MYTIEDLAKIEVLAHEITMLARAMAVKTIYTQEGPSEDDTARLQGEFSHLHSVIIGELIEASGVTHDGGVL